jgi:hypothetical protein
VLLEFWKLKKGFDISITSTFPYLSVASKAAHREGQTDLFDNVATKWLAVCLLPCVPLYAAYSIMYQEYKSWWSFTIGTLAGFIYMTGFLMMTPQLYINYKMKSVENMPWKVLTYRALNTFIDDLFSFILPMPTMHRVACFRDDIIFILYVIQRFKYATDPNRHYLETVVNTPVTEAVASEAPAGDAAAPNAIAHDKVD